VRLPGRPGFLLLRGNRLWVTLLGSRSGAPGRLARIDARSGRLQRIFRLPVEPNRLAYGFGSLWLTGRNLLRLDPRSGRVVRMIRGSVGFGAALAVTSDGVWVGGPDGYPQGHPDQTRARLVFKIDPRLNAVVRRVWLKPTTVIDLISEGSSLWATGWGGVVKLSATGHLLFRKRFDGSGWAMALAPGTVWIAQPFFGNRDPRTQRPARRLLKVTTKPPRLTVAELKTPPGDVAAAAGLVWVGSNGGLARFDGTRTPPTLTTVLTSVVPNRIEAFAGGVWVGERHKNELRKVC
jgi:hypothetical protein